MTSGFVGCLRDFRLKGKRIGKWSNNHRSGVKPCSEKVETGTFIGPAGGFIHAFKKFRVGLDFDITMKIKPREVILIFSGIQKIFGRSTGSGWWSHILVGLTLV